MATTTAANTPLLHSEFHTNFPPRDTLRASQHSMVKYFVVIASWADVAIVTHDERGRTTTSKTILNNGRQVHSWCKQGFVGTEPCLWPNNAQIYCKCIKGCYAGVLLQPKEESAKMRF